jgi:hypothetical protein
LPETCTVVISIKLEFGASVGFIHKEYVTIHGHTIVKYGDEYLGFLTTGGFLTICVKIVFGRRAVLHGVSRLSVFVASRSYCIQQYIALILSVIIFIIVNVMKYNTHASIHKL